MSRLHWKSRLGLVFAAAGSAVGLGNFLRFPGQAYINGGGAFLVPYIMCFFLVAIPLLWVEWSLGKIGGEEGKHSSPGIFSVYVKNRFFSSILGTLAVLIPAGIYFYYALIQSWCIGYFIYYLGLLDFSQVTDPNQASQLFDYISKRDRSGFEASFPLLVLLVTVILNSVIILGGFIKSIEKFCLIAIPLMAVCAFIVLLRVLTLGVVDEGAPERNVWNALGFMWNPRGVGGKENWLANFLNPQVWLSAFGQVFFSVSIGFGILIHYASYVKKREDIALSSLSAAATNGFFEVCIGGLITIPVIYLFLGDNFEADSSFSLGFVSMPLVFNRMSFGEFFGAVWFMMLFLAAITSSVSMISPVVSFFEEYLHMSGLKARIASNITLAVGNFLVFIFSKELSMLSTLDFWIGTVCIFLFSGLMLFSAMHYLGLSKILAILKEGSLISVPKVTKHLLMIISPALFLVIFLAWVIKVLPNQIHGYFESFESTVGMIVFIALTTIIFSIIYPQTDSK